MNRLVVGARVRHSYLGNGSVMEIQRGGRVVRVCFDNKPQVGWLVVASELMPVIESSNGMEAVMSALARRHEVTVDAPPPVEPSRLPAAPPSPPASHALSLLPEADVAIHVPADITEAQALHAVEALRLGVVPRHLIETYTVGRSSEMAMVNDDLEGTLESGAFRVVMGDYGTGKTHHLEYVEGVALSRNYMTARVTLDAREVPPSMPKRVYRQIVRALRYPDLPGTEAGGVGPLFERILRDHDLVDDLLRADGPSYHKYLSPALNYYRDLRQHDPSRALLEMMLDWVEGHPTVSNVLLDQRLKQEGKRYHRLYALMDYCPWSHIYAYLIGGLGAWARRAGYNGLVLLLDEAEFYSLLSSGHAYYAAVLFSYYAAAALGRSRVKIDVDDLPRGGHPVHRAIPSMYADAQHLYVTFAITPDSSGVKVLEGLVGAATMVELSPLGAGDYTDLCARVWGLYRRAYPESDLPSVPVQRLGTLLYQGVEWGRLGNVRQALKLLVEMVDFTRHDPERASIMMSRFEQALGAHSFS